MSQLAETPVDFNGYFEGIKKEIMKMTVAQRGMFVSSLYKTVLQESEAEVAKLENEATLNRNNLLKFKLDLESTEENQ